MLSLGGILGAIGGRRIRRERLNAAASVELRRLLTGSGDRASDRLIKEAAERIASDIVSGNFDEIWLMNRLSVAVTQELMSRNPDSESSASIRRIMVNLHERQTAPQPSE